MRRNLWAKRAAGKILLEHADALADRLELARSQLAELAGDQRLRVGAFPSALAALVLKAVARMAAGAARGDEGAGPGARAARGDEGAGAVRSRQVLVEEGSTPALAERVRRANRALVTEGLAVTLMPKLLATSSVASSCVR